MTDESEDPVLWGARAIAKEANLTERRAFYLLARGLLPATKVGDSWCARRSELRRRLSVGSTDAQNGGSQRFPG